jgi:DNA-binding HxlR family transcriptional regulator
MNQSRQHQLRSTCPVNFALEIFGDKWSLLIIRDMIFAGKRTYNELLDSPEKIATNILAARLKMLEETGIIKKEYDPNRKTRTKYVYAMTTMGLDLVPLFLEIMLWGDSYHPMEGTHKQITKQAQQNKAALVEEIRRSVQAHKPVVLSV